MSEGADGAPGFVTFLLQDNLDLSSPTTQQVLEVINTDLSQLLRLPPQQFWQVVISDPSLHACLDSFLRFRRRCYDESPESVQGSSDLLLQLSQRVFRVYWRMAHPQEQQQQQQQGGSSSSSAAGSAASKPKLLQQQQVPSASQAAELLYGKWLLDVPKMMDIAVLYGPGTSQLTRQLLQQLLVLQPKYAQDIFSLSMPLTANVRELLESVRRLANQLLSPTPASSTAGGAAASKQLLSELAEAVSFFTDACLTVQALVNCLPAAAGLLLHPHHHGELLIVLAATYSSTLPLMRRVAQQPAAADVPGLAAQRLQRLQQCLESLLFHLLRAAFCTQAGVQAAHGPAAAAAAAVAAGAAAASAGNSSSSSGKGGKQPPPGFGGSIGSTSKKAGGTSFDPEVQGQELMNLLMLLAHPGDVLQPSSSSSGSGSMGAAHGSLLAAVNHAYHLDVAVSAAVSEGLLALDDAQFDYFLALVDGDRQLLEQRQQQQQHQWMQQAVSTSRATATATATAAAGAGTSGTGSGSRQQLPPDLPAKIASIKELLPEYGDGFLTAALFHNSHNTEQVINCLLEGSLPKGLQGIDPGLKTWSPPIPAGGSNVSSTGAATAAAAQAGTSSSNSGLSWTGLAREAAAAAAAAPVPERVTLPSLSAAATAAPKAGVERRTGRLLGALSGRVRDYTKNIAQEMQFEYDDEYDDSFDDLVGPGNDGVCDIEGEDSSSANRPRGPAARAPGPLASSSAAAAAAAAAAGGADEYADEPTEGPARRPVAQQQQQQQQQHRGRPPQQRKERLWVLDGRVYNYKKEGAQEVAGQAGAQAALKAAQQAAQEIHGLGPGGNVPLPPVAADGGKQGGAGSSRGGDGAAAGGGRGAPSGGDRSGRAQHPPAAGDGSDGDGGGGGAGRGRGRGSYAHKEQHKAAVANHHRRDRAAQKQARGMF